MTTLPDLSRRNGMYVLYESDNFAVVHMQSSYSDTNKVPALQISDDIAPDMASGTAPAASMLKRHGFEIVDKRSGRYLYLDGSWAEIFIQQITAWQHNTPTQEEVEETLDGYAHLAAHRLVLH